MKLSRRDLLKLAGSLSIMSSAYVAWQLLGSSENPADARPASLGTTFSQLQCRYLDIDAKETFAAVQTLGFDVVRLCTYWNEVEAQEGIYDFSLLDWLLHQAEDAGQQVIVCVGMKAPRWPEFHFPRWVADKYEVTRTDIPLDRVPGLAEETLVFTGRVVEHIKQYRAVKYWQVENEALNIAPVAGGRFLSTEFMSKEINLVRKAMNPGQKILFTFGADPPLAIQNAQQMLSSILPLVDAVGFDIYAKIPVGIGLIEYVEVAPPFWWNLATWRDFVKDNGKEAWIAESQAEPWEQGKLVAIDRKDNPSSNPQRAVHLATTLSSMSFNPVLLWGCEFWYWHKKRANSEWWARIAAYIRASRVQ